MKKETKEKLINLGIKVLPCAACGVFVGLVGVVSYRIGLDRGQDRLIEELIHNCEYGENDNPVYMSSDPELGHLMYELSAECIGD